MSPVTANFLFEAANFLILAAALGWLLFKPIRRALEAEREKHAREEAEGQRLRAEAQTLKAEAERLRSSADQEIAQRQQTLLAEAQTEAARLLEAARTARVAERRTQEQELRADREAQARALADTVGRLAAGSVRQLLAAAQGPSLDAALIRLARPNLEHLAATARASARVEVARPLESESRQLLQDALGAPFSEQVVPELGAGVRVTTVVGQVDATATALAREAARAVMSRFEQRDA